MIQLLASLFLASGFAHAADPLTIDVHRDPNCGCCTAWIEHLEENGITVNDHLETDMRSFKQAHGVPAELASCHTGLIDGRFIEGHVPATDILAMYDKKEIKGLAVPGMPVGSPGMEMGDRKDAYKVISVDEKGSQAVFSTYP